MLQLRGLGDYFFEAVYSPWRPRHRSGSASPVPIGQIRPSGIQEAWLSTVLHVCGAEPERETSLAHVQLQPQTMRQPSVKCADEGVPVPIWVAKQPNFAVLARGYLGSQKAISGEPFSFGRSSAVEPL